MLLSLALACRPEPQAPPIPQIDVVLSDNPKTVLEKRLQLEGVPDGMLVELACTSPGDPLEDHHLQRTGSGELRLYGLLADTPYGCTLSDPDGTPLWWGSFLTDPLPEGMAVMRVSGEPSRTALDEGYLLVNHWKLGSRPEVQRLLVVDGHGQIRWYLAFPDAETGGLAGTWLTPDTMITGGGQSSPPALRDLSGDAWFTVPPELEPDPGYHHEALVTSEGWLVSLQGVTNTLGGASFVGFRIEAYDPATGELAWEYDSQADVDAGVLPVPPPTDPDPYHANAISFVDDDPEGPGVWVALRGLGTVARIDKASRRITYQLGPGLTDQLVDPDGQPLSDDDWFWSLHDPEVQVRDGAIEILLYDNGGRRPGAPYSRAARYRLSAPGTVELLWEWTEPRWYEPNFGSVQTLPDGHVLIGTGHCVDCGTPGDTAWVAEVDPVTQSVVWRLDLTGDDDSLYRAEYIDGCAIFANRRACP
jgi:hypothetical protein